MDRHESLHHDINFCAGWHRGVVKNGDVSLRVICGTRMAQQKTCPVAFAHPLHILDEPRCLANANYQDASRQRVQSASMPGFRGMAQPIDPVHDIARGPAGRLVYVEDPCERHGVHSAAALPSLSS